MTTILINNKFVAKKDAKVSVLSSFGRGYGIFETLRTYENKKLFKKKAHINRLLDSAKKIDLTLKYDKTQILKMIDKVAEKSPHKIQKIKIMAIPEALIIISVTMNIEKKIYRGVSCISIKSMRCMPEIKSISYLPSFLSHEKAVKKKCFDAILIDKKGEVHEGAYSNIFWFEGDRLCTRKENVLPGITRQTVLKISPFKIKFKTINIKDLRKAHEVFLTTSISGIVPITKIDGKKIYAGKPGENTKILMRKFKQCVASTSR